MAGRKRGLSGANTTKGKAHGYRFRCGVNRGSDVGNGIERELSVQMKHTTPIAVVAAISAAGVFVVLEAHGQTYLGAGGTRCSEYLRQVRANDPLRYAFEHWVLGYLSGMNAAVKVFTGVDPLAKAEGAQALTFVRGYCSGNGSHTVVNAANAFFETLRP